MPGNSSSRIGSGWPGRSVAQAVGTCGVLGVLAPPVLAQAASSLHEAGGLLLLPIVALAGAALQPVLAILFPRWTTATRTIIEQRRGLCLLWGFLLWLFVFVLLALTNVVGRWIGALGALVLLVASLLSVAGFVGVAAAAGTRLVQSDPTGDDRTPAQALAGGLVLYFASLVPILGQILAIAIAFASLGAAVSSLCCRPALPDDS